MELRSLGTSEVKITPIIMGTWQAGKEMWVGIDDSETIKALRAAFEAGITTIDTAEYYGNGHSERIVGEALADVRDQVVYATKVFSNHLRYDQVMEACHGSLKNLKTDYLDLYQIHWPAGSWGTELVPIEETMRALNDLRKQGKIRAIGCVQLLRGAAGRSIWSWPHRQPATALLFILEIFGKRRTGLLYREQHYRSSLLVSRPGTTDGEIWSRPQIRQGRSQGEKQAVSSR